MHSTKNVDYLACGVSMYIYCSRAEVKYDGMPVRSEFTMCHVLPIMSFRAVAWLCLSTS